MLWGSFSILSAFYYKEKRKSVKRGFPPAPEGILHIVLLFFKDATFSMQFWQRSVPEIALKRQRPFSSFFLFFSHISLKIPFFNPSPHRHTPFLSLIPFLHLPSLLSVSPSFSVLLPSPLPFSPSFSVLSPLLSPFSLLFLLSSLSLFLPPPFSSPHFSSPSRSSPHLSLLPPQEMPLRYAFALSPPEKKGENSSFFNC